ncbi:MAG: hypothetical protein ACOH1L_06550 [Thermomonas sp.]
MLRTSVLALFVLGTVVQPVAVSMSEIHALSHESIEHGLVAHQSLVEHSNVVASGVDEDGSSGALHALHHFAHCCGSFTAIMTAGFDLPLPPVAGGLLAAGESQARTNTLELAPYRPPITA